MPPIKLEVSDVTTTPSSDAKPKELNKCSQLELKGLESIAPLVRSVEETPEPIATEVRGTIPTWIRGNLLRNGPGKFEFGNQHYNHWFDGMAMLHQFKIEDGKVTYRSRFLQSDAYKKNSERDRIMVSEFGTVAMPDPCKNFFLRFLSRFEMIAMSENYVVFIEQPIKMDLLKIVTAKLRGKGISEGVYWDPKQDTVFHLVDKHTGQTSSVKFHTKALSVFHQINAFEEDGFLMLDMCCSDNGEAINNYLIQNLRKSGEALDQVYNTTYRAFPRRFVLPLNVTDDTPTGVNLNTRPASSATSFKTAIDKVVCQFEDLHGEDLYEYGGLEFPQINYSKFNTRPYRYFYGCGFRHLVGDSLLKIDLEGKKVKVWYQKGLFPSEPVFVPSPDAVEEDDGVILSVVVTPTEDKSTFLLVLDAKTWEELGRAEVPVNIPYGFHGTFNPTT
ncbi:carotenoid-cleaving dioxygenase, mitochondrial-like isoform X4 [Salvelinus fontinalis]|uniref:carotenoid-cleaving dioxygenase, mitochondrial-like isoform X4 n=1 Tax=Salvelinus fontinalis TaxID=8038 RepID=UPI002485EE44|nr:carotenoid-cleaving dioxygenase, mitochondrial-like isoform X4 [Salvelinus fontinalis]